jgi:MurNAc alpha-1-phosphate uridylyltransferase
MILAAGLGTRMGAISQSTPKPLVEVAGISLMDRLLAHAKMAELERLIVNVHHLAEQMEAALEDEIAAGFVQISDERNTLLETGGGVKKALPLLGEDPFFVMNGDALWVDKAESNLARLKAHWDASKMDALLMLVPTADALGYDGVGDFFADDDTLQPIRFRDDAASAPYMFGGVQIIDPSLYEGTPEGPFSNRAVFRKAAARGRLYGLAINGHWMHVGTPEAISAAEEKLAAIGAA